MKKKKIGSGIYLVIDPSMQQALLFRQLEKALQASLSAVQIWDNWLKPIDKDNTIRKIIDLCASYRVPVLINNDWSLMKSYPFDGVHFDEVPSDFKWIRTELRSLSASGSGEDVLIGITCNNDMELIQWATDNELDYLSFCSMFPSSTSNSCELVSLASVRQARTISNLPIFLAGGIRPENLHAFAQLDYQGVALVSGIMSSPDPKEAVEIYLNQLNKNQS